MTTSRSDGNERTKIADKDDDDDDDDDEDEDEDEDGAVVPDGRTSLKGHCRFRSGIADS